MKKIVCLFILLTLLPINVGANDLAPSAKSVIVLEQSTGDIIYERNSNEKLNPASMTNIMDTVLQQS